MKTSDAFPSRYLSHDDLDGDVTVTIRSVALQDMQRPGTSERVEKPVIEFDELDKGLVCNKTNWLAIARQHGDESDDWTGKDIVLGVERVRFGNDHVEAIRVRATTRPPATGQPAPSAPVKFSGDWREVKIHFGKLRNRRLDELTPQQLAWFTNEWKPRPHPLNKSFSGTDLLLRAALDASLRETAQPQPDQPSLAIPADHDVPF
jgi:hypothetical protein